jgi:peptidoglycan hydrolase-like protein with peptidoglycan-binding domain
MPRPSDTVAFAEIGIDHAARSRLNGDLRGARNSTMLSLIGNPRADYDSQCRHPTTGRIARLMETADLGPFRATGLRVAIQSLRRVMADIKAEHPAIHDVMSTAGMLCCRLVRGSSSAISNHSWGSAIDIKLEGHLDRRGDGRTQRGLLDIHPIFNRHGWYWGAAFKTEDAMHFEASDQLVQQWAAAGEFGERPPGRSTAVCDFGDRGPEVEVLQVRLVFATGLAIGTDGIFGRETRAAVMEFQRTSGLVVDGIVGPRTWESLLECTKSHAL